MWYHFDVVKRVSLLSGPPGVVSIEIYARGVCPNLDGERTSFSSIDYMQWLIVVSGWWWSWCGRAVVNPCSSSSSRLQQASRHRPTSHAAQEHVDTTRCCYHTTRADAAARWSLTTIHCRRRWSGTGRSYTLLAIPQLLLLLLQRLHSVVISGARGGCLEGQQRQQRRVSTTSWLAIASVNCCTRTAAATAAAAAAAAATARAKPPPSKWTNDVMRY